MRAREISGVEYGLLVSQLDDLPEDEAEGFRSRLAEKYYAYLDRLMQLKMALREYDGVVAELRRKLESAEPGLKNGTNQFS